MRQIVARILANAGVLACLLGVSAAPASAISAPTAAWDIKQQTYPTNIAPGGPGAYQINIYNIGAAISVGDPTVTVTLPPGVTATSAGGFPHAFYWSCPGAAGATTVTCKLNSAVLVDGGLIPGEGLPDGASLVVRVSAASDVAVVGEAVATISGGGALRTDTSRLQTRFTSELSRFEITRMAGGANNRDATPARQAGSHPDVTTSVDFSTNGENPIVVAGNLKDVAVELPEGLVADPTAVPACDADQLGDSTRGAQCSPDTQVGVADVLITDGAKVADQRSIPIYNVESPIGWPGRLAFNVGGVVINLKPEIRSDGRYRIAAAVNGNSQTLAVTGTKVTLWGVPTDPVHDVLRQGSGQIPPQSSHADLRPFMTAPTECSGKPLVTKMTARTWQEPDRWVGASFSTDFNDEPILVQGCDALPFSPSAVLSATNVQPDAPTGLEATIDSPQRLEDPNGFASAQLRDVKVALPEALTINPGSADGLAACSDGQLGLGTNDPVSCPDGSKIGTVTAKSPLLEEELRGGAFIRTQASSDPGSGEMFRMAIVLENKERGVIVKLPGAIRVNPDTGRIVTEFDDNPQVPVEHINLTLKSGPRAPLATPKDCGEKAMETGLTSWAGHALTQTSHFTVPCTAGLGGFAPALNAGTVRPIAGAYSPFTVGITKPDGNADLNGLSMSLPAGLLAQLKGNLGSQVGTVKAFAGPGSNPFALPGQVYLEGQYGDAPFSLKVVVPAKAGPFDLGEVVVRQKIYVDPIDAHVTVVSDPVPTIIKGVPARLQRLEVSVDKPEFIINPTSCAPKTISGTLSAAGGQTAAVSNHFQVSACKDLDLKPSLALSLSGKGQTTDGKHPAVTATLTQKPGQANLKKVRVALPLSLALDPDNAASDDLCSFAEGSKADPKCPKSSVVGKATAVSPILNQPLTGPVYFVKNERKDPKSGRSIKTTPKLVIPLVGENDVKLTLTGTSTVADDQLVTTFDNIPDAPVSSFKMDITGGKKGILVVSGADICKATQIADQQVDGQNNEAADTDVFIQTPSCPLKVLSKKVGKRSVTLKLSGLGAGKVTVSGKGIKKTTKRIAKSTVATITAKRAKGRVGKVKVSFVAAGAKKAKTVSATLG